MICIQNLLPPPPWLRPLLERWVELRPGEPDPPEPPLSALGIGAEVTNLFSSMSLTSPNRYFASAL